MAAPRKYVFKNGVLVSDAPSSATAYAAATQTTTAGAATARTVPLDVPLAMVCSPIDLASATEATAASGAEMKIPVGTQAAIEGFYDPSFMTQYQTPGLTSGESILDHLGSVFSRLEIPLGILSKLLVLSGYTLNFIVDDSGSMQCDTDSEKAGAGDFMIRRYRAQRVDLHVPMSRWEEVEDRLHTMMDILAYVPTGRININFLNRSTSITLDRTGKPPEVFVVEAHSLIENQFAAKPQGGTPIYASLSRAFSRSKTPTLHYLFTDGEPSDATVDKVTQLVLNRPNPTQNPVTFVSCTNEDSATEWMKDIDDKGPMLAEVDDFESERREVISKQGPILPYSRGLWLMCLIVGAINPDDLDNLDDSTPITKRTLDNLLGRELSQEEYFLYFSRHPQYPTLKSRFTEFFTATVPSRMLASPQPKSFFHF